MFLFLAVSYFIHCNVLQSLWFCQHVALTTCVNIFVTFDVAVLNTKLLSHFHWFLFYTCHYLYPVH